MSKQPKTFAQAQEEFQTALAAVFEPVYLPILHWLDRQIGRWPRLYDRLSR